MLVVTIIGILASIVAVRISGQGTKAKITATRATMVAVRLGIGQYEMEHGKLPDTLSELVDGDTHYLDQETVPLDQWESEFKYYRRGDLVKIHSAGPDGVFGTDDDIINK